MTLRDLRRGPAYPFWELLQQELTRQGMSLNELVRRSGVTASFISLLRTSPPRSAGSRTKNVHKLAETLGIDKTKAEQLAGIAAPDPADNVDVRDAIYRSRQYNDNEKKALIGLLDVLDASKRSAIRVDDTA